MRGIYWKKLNVKQFACILCVWGVQKGRFANLANNLPKWYNLVRHGYKAPDPRLFQHRPTACCETASRFVVSAAALALPPSPLEVALSHPADAFHRPPTPTGTHPHTTGGYTPANTRQQCQNIGGDGQETAGGCRRSRGTGWCSGSPVDCCRGHGAALATEMSARRAFGGRPREPAASVRRSEALAADGGWARGGAGPRRGAAALETLAADPPPLPTGRPPRAGKAIAMGGGRFAHPVPARGAPAARPAICERAGRAAVAEWRGRGEVGWGRGGWRSKRRVLL